MEILNRESLPRGGFAGLKETLLIRDSKITSAPLAWQGLGQFVYLADATYLPFGETTMHSHTEIDVITVLLEGRLTHEGSMENGQSMQSNQVQVQRAGGEGFSHNEINPDEKGTRLLQLWALPETAGEKAAYKLYDLADNQLVKIYGGAKTQNETFDSHTTIQVGLLLQGKEITQTGEFLAYISSGHGLINNVNVSEGDLIRGNDLHLQVNSHQLHLTLISQGEG